MGRLQCCQLYFFGTLHPAYREGDNDNVVFNAVSYLYTNFVDFGTRGPVYWRKEWLAEAISIVL